MKVPDTDAGLYDYLQRLFGVGDWDETSTTPWYRARMHEITKIKARRLKLGVTVAELVRAADYCKAQHLDIRNAAWLYHHLGDARRWAAANATAAAVLVLEARIADALAYEMTQPSSRWLDQLIRAQGPHRQEVFDRWEQQHASPAVSSAPDPSSGR